MTFEDYLKFGAPESNKPLKSFRCSFNGFDGNLYVGEVDAAG